MGIAVVLGLGGLVWLLVVALYERIERKAKAEREAADEPRLTWNAYAREMWREDGFYPHEDDNGNVRWYRAPRYAVDNGRPSTD